MVRGSACELWYLVRLADHLWEGEEAAFAIWSPELLERNTLCDMCYVRLVRIAMPRLRAALTAYRDESFLWRAPPGM